MVGYRSDRYTHASVVDIFNDPRLIDLVEEHLGCVPTLYSLNGWWVVSGEPARVGLLAVFPPDIDDWRFLTLFLFLSMSMRRGPASGYQGIAHWWRA